MARTLIFLLVWIVQISLVVLFASSTWLQGQISNEQRSVVAYLGADSANSVTARTDAAFRTIFVETEMINHVHRYLIPSEEVPKHGTDGLAPWFFNWLDDSLRTFWLLAYQGIYRVVLFNEWAQYLGVLLLAALIDGLVERKIRKENLGYANPVRYRVGVRAMIVLGIVPLLYLTVPICVPPQFIPFWMVTLSLVLMLVAANAQHRI